MANEPIIEVEAVTKIYHMGGVEVPALRGVDFSARAGEFLAVLGPSGSGKSTLFHIIGGLTPPSAGRVRVAGRDLTTMSDAERTSLRRTGVGFVFQRFNLLPTLSAAENIEIARHIAGNRGNDSTFQEVLALLGIEHRLHHKPYALSGRRTAACRHRPRHRQPSRRFCWPMNRRETWIRKIPKPCSRLSRPSMRSSARRS